MKYRMVEKKLLNGNRKLDFNFKIWKVSYQYSMNYSKSPKRLHLFLIVIPGHQCFVSLADTFQQVLHKIWSFEKDCINNKT